MNTPEASKFIAVGGSFVLAVAGAGMVAGGQPSGWGVLAFSALCAVVSLLPQQPRKTDTVDISDWGIRRTVGDEISEEISWQELVQVSIRTTSSGPAMEDVFFLLHGHAQKGVLVPHSVAVEKGLLEALQRRLPGFDNVALVQAMGSTTDQSFVVWRASEAQQSVQPDRREDAAPG